LPDNAGMVGAQRRSDGTRVEARAWWGRAEFDGLVLTVVRYWRPGRRRRVSYPIADLGRVSRHIGNTEVSWSRWCVHLRSGVEVPFRVSDRAARRFERVSHAVNLAVAERTRVILRDTVGLGPWSDEVWDRVIALSPGMARLRARRPVEVGNVDNVLAGLRDPALQPTTINITWVSSVRGIDDTRPMPDRSGRPSAHRSPWDVLLDALAGHTEGSREA
jgi:hypothetical protein